MFDSFSDGWNRLGKVSKSWIITLFAMFLLNAVGQNFLGVSIPLLAAFSPEQIFAGEIWRLVTYPLVEGNALRLLISCVILYLFGLHYERVWGSKEYFRFAVIITIGAGVIAAILQKFIPLSSGSGLYTGPHAFVDALLVYMVVKEPNSKILFGFVLPIQTKVLVGFFILLTVLQALNGEPNHLYLYFAAMLVSYLYSSGKFQRLMTPFAPKKKEPHLKIVH